MATRKDFQIDRRVAIARDALTDSQKAALDSILRSKEVFTAHAAGPGRGKKWSKTKPLYQVSAGRGLRVFYSIVDDNIVVLDVMRKATMDRLGRKRKGKASPVKKGPDYGSETELPEGFSWGADISGNEESGPRTRGAG